MDDLIQSLIEELVRAEVAHQLGRRGPPPTAPTDDLEARLAALERAIGLTETPDE